MSDEDETSVPSLPGPDLLGAWEVPEPAPDLADRVLDHVETAMNTMTDAPIPEPATMPVPRRGGLGLAVVGVAMVAAAALVLGLTPWWRAPAPVEPGPAVVVAPAAQRAAVSPDGAALVVRTVPRDASTRIDGTPLAGPSPFAVSSLSPGTHRLEVEREGYLPFSRVIEGGAPLQLPVELQLRDVVLVLSVEPSEATVHLHDGRTAVEIGGDGTRHALRREPGVKYELEASAPGYRTRRVPLSLGREADVPVSLSLVVDPDAPPAEVAEPIHRAPRTHSSGSPDLKDPFKRSGSSTASGTSRPRPEPKAEVEHSRSLQDPFAKKSATLRVGTKAGASPGKVYVDGEYLGRTPILNIRLRPGMHDVKVVFEDGTAWEQTIEMAKDETRTVRAG